MAANDRDRSTEANKTAKPPHPETHTDFIDGPHGRHGGSEESEGRPQKDGGTGSADSGKHRASGSSDTLP
jgi:hypothetical protein